MGDPLHTIETEKFKAIFMLGADDDVDTVDDVDAEVVLPDGSRWSATFMTLEAISRILTKWRLSGECLGGTFFQCPDLVIVRSPGVPAMLDVIKGLVDGDEERLEDTFQRLEPDDGDQDDLS